MKELVYVLSTFTVLLQHTLSDRGASKHNHNLLFGRVFSHRKTYDDRTNDELKVQ